MDQNDHKRTDARRTRPITRWLTLLSAIALLGMFVSPIGAAAQDTAEYDALVTYSVTLSPSSQTRVIGNSVTITASVRSHIGSNNYPAPLVNVTFSVSGVNSGGASHLTNGSGTTSFSYTGENTGDDTVTATLGVGGSDTAAVHWIPTEATLTLDPPTQTLDLDSTATINATLVWPTGNPYNIPIRYSVTGANSAGGAVNTDTNGDAVIHYDATHVGTDTLTAFADLNKNLVQDSDEPSDSVTVVWTDITITLSPSTQTESLGNRADIDATVMNGSTAMSNVRVRYSITGANSGGGSVFTNSSGKATFGYSGIYAGTDTVKAFADLNKNDLQDSGEPSQTVTVIWTGAGLTLSPATQTVAAGTQASVTATLTNPSNSVSGVTIRYTVSGANSTSGTASTDSGGDATISYTGNNVGTDTVTAYADLNNNSSQDAGEPSASATVTRTGSASLDLAPGNASPTTGTTENIDIALTRTSGSVASVVIRYSVTGANSKSGSVTTDGSGNGVLSYSGSNAGADTVSAFADFNNNGVQDSGEPSDTATINWQSPSNPPPSNTFEPAQPSSPKAGCTYFPATQHNLCAGFLSYWNKYGGLAVFGMPLTEEFQENGMTVLYTERARFEWHPGADPSHFDVLLGLLGNVVTEGRSNEAPFKTAAAKTATGCTYYAATGHNLCGGFAAYWNMYGGLAIYGYPISEEFQEKNPDTGQVYTVQYFQRGRFEWHPGEWPERFDVELGRLGAQVLQMRYGVSYY